MFLRITLLIAFLALVVFGEGCGGGTNTDGTLPTPEPSSTLGASPTTTTTPSPTPCPSSSSATQRVLVITSPCSGSEVIPLQLVEGTVSDPNVRAVWVIIHPMETTDYWVQQKATVEDGSWAVVCHYGESGLHKGKPYEFLAVANPHQGLDNGQILEDWPEAQYTSQLIRRTQRE